MFAPLLAAALTLTLPASSGRTLSLDEAVGTALAHQPQLRQAHAGTDAAWARADEARAPILPQVVGTAGYQRATGNFAPRPGALPSTATGAAAGGGSLTTYNYFNFGVTLSQFIWDFGQTTDKWKSAQASASATGQTERATRLSVIANVRTAYFAARASRDLVEVARETLANQEKHLKQIQEFVQVGTRPEIDLAQAKTDRANAQAQLINAENSYSTARAQLNIAMGIEAPIDYDVETGAPPAIDGEDSPLDALVDEAVRARPELRSMQEQLKAQRLQVSSAKGAYGPSIGAAMSLTDAGTDITAMGWNWSAGVNLTWPLFSGLLTRSQVREAKAGVTSLEAQFDSVRQQVRLDVEQAQLAVRAGRSSLVANGEALVNARELLRLAEGRYASGVGNAIELGDAQVALTNAAAQKTQAEFNLAVARAQLVHALGRDS